MSQCGVDGRAASRLLLLHITNKSESYFYPYTFSLTVDPDVGLAMNRLR